MNPWALVLVVLALLFLVGILIAFIRRQSHWLLIGVGMSLKAAAAAALIASGIGPQRVASAGLFFFCLVLLLNLIFVCLGVGLRSLRFQGDANPSEQKEIRN